MAVTRKARLGLGFEVERGSARSLVDIETLAGGVGQLSLPYSLRWLLDALTGLGALHEAPLDPGGPGFVHGEVTPERLWLDADGVGKLVPLVPAHWARNASTSTEWIGYLAPETLLGDVVDVRADLFSIGVMLWEALAGERLFNEPTAEAIVMRLMSGKVAPPELAPDDAWAEPLAIIAKRAIAVNPRQRFESARELRTAIEAAAPDHLASRSGMADLHRNPASGSRRVTAAVTVPRPKAESLAEAVELTRVYASSIPAPSGDVDALLSVPVSAPKAKVPSERPAPRLSPVPEPHSERNDQAGFFEAPEESERRGNGSFWVVVVLVFLLVVGGTLALPPVRNHPAVAGLIGRAKLIAGLAPANAESHKAPVPASKSVPNEASTATEEAEPAAPSEPEGVGPSVTPGEQAEPGARPGARRAPGRKRSGRAHDPAPPPEPKPAEAPAPPPPAAAPPPPPEPPKPAPPKPADEDRDRYGI